MNLLKRLINSKAAPRLRIDKLGFLKSHVAGLDLAYSGSKRSTGLLCVLVESAQKRVPWQIGHVVWFV